jgi:hypothetical protein
MTNPATPVPRVRTDFNTQTPDGFCWALFYDDKPLSDQMEELGLTKISELLTDNRFVK